jgi:hypothetical protein
MRNPDPNIEPTRGTRKTGAKFSGTREGGSNGGRFRMCQVSLEVTRPQPRRVC